MKRIGKLEYWLSGLIIVSSLFAFWYTAFAVNPNPNKYRLSPKYYWHYGNKELEEMNLATRALYMAIQNRPSLSQGILKEEDLKNSQYIIMYYFDRPHLIMPGQDNVHVSSTAFNNAAPDKSKDKFSLEVYMDLSKAQGQYIYGLSYLHDFTLTTGPVNSAGKIQYKVKDNSKMIGIFNPLPENCAGKENWHINVSDLPQNVGENALEFNPCGNEIKIRLTPSSRQAYENSGVSPKLTKAFLQLFGPQNSGPADNLFRFAWACNVFTLIDSEGYRYVDSYLSELETVLYKDKDKENKRVAKNHQAYLKKTGSLLGLEFLLLGLIIFSIHKTIYYYQRLVLDVKLFIATSRVRKTAEAQARNEARIAELRRQKTEMIRKREAEMTKAQKAAQKEELAKQQATEEELKAGARKADLLKYLEMDLSVYTQDRFVSPEKRQELNNAWLALAKIDQAQDLITAPEEIELLNCFARLLLAADQALQVKSRQCEAVKLKIKKILGLDPIYLARLTNGTKDRLKQIPSEICDSSLTPRKLRQLDHEVDQMITKHKLPIS